MNTTARTGWVFAFLAVTAALSILTCVLFWLAIWNRDSGLLLRAGAAWLATVLSYLTMVVLATGGRRP